jgi:ribosomal protein S18 acetylase RimI-like enzyme
MSSVGQRRPVQLRRLPPEEDAVRRYVEELWVPYHRDLSTAVEAHDLDDSVDLVAEETEFRVDLLESDEYRAWVAVDAPAADPVSDDLATVEADLAGFVTTSVDEAPTVFDQPDRLVVGDIYVAEPYRGGGLATALMERAGQRAREAGCAEVGLDVDVDHERALAFYERLGFEPLRHRMTLDAAEL